MDCPHCGQFVPDTNYLCPHCKKTVKDSMDPAEFSHRQEVKRTRSSANSFIVAIIVIGIAVLAFLMLQKSKSPSKAGSTDTTVNSTVSKRTDTAGTDREDESYDTGSAGGDLEVGYVVNKDNPGQEIQIEDFVQGDQMTIFDFYSDYCPPCKKFAPWLKALDEKRNDIVVFKVDINRPGVRGIDWRAPIVQQYGIQGIPHFIIYDVGGTKLHEGRKARQLIEQLLYKEDIVK